MSDGEKKWLNERETRVKDELWLRVAQLEENNPITAAAPGQEVQTAEESGVFTGETTGRWRRSWRNITKRINPSCCCDVQLLFWRCAGQTTAPIQRRIEFKSSVGGQQIWIPTKRADLVRQAVRYPAYEVRNEVKHHVYLFFVLTRCSTSDWQPAAHLPSSGLNSREKNVAIIRWTQSNNKCDWALVQKKKKEKGGLVAGLRLKSEAGV